MWKMTVRLSGRKWNKGYINKKPPLILAMLWLGLRLWCLTLRSTILLVEEAGVPGENHQPTESHS